MKVFITMFDVNKRVDAPLTPLFRAFEQTTLKECDVVFIPITYMDDYKADSVLMAEVLVSNKKIVVFDFVEYGWDEARPDHLFGVNTEKWTERKFHNRDYINFLDGFIKSNAHNVILYFKRELVNDSALNPPFKVLPIEYPGANTIETSVDSFEEYNNRPIDVMMVWGLSNPSRPILHGEFCKRSALNGQHLVGNLEHVSICQQRGEKRMSVMAFVPDFARISIHQILHIQSMAKISISMNGCGKKCFRHAEASFNSAMALQETDYKWSHPWVDDNSAIVLPNRDNSTLIDEIASYENIRYYLSEPERLYHIYKQGISNWKNYEATNYSNYILKEIEATWGN